MPNDKNDFGVKVKPIMTQNPQANAIAERVHQTIGNMIRTFDLYDNDGIDDPWSGILAAVMAAVRSKYSTTTQATPMQLVFGRNAMRLSILNLSLIGIIYVNANKYHTQ